MCAMRAANPNLATHLAIPKMNPRLRQLLSLTFRSLKEKERDFRYQVSLAGVLIIPFIVQVCAVVSLVGYLAHRNAEQAVEDLTNQLMVAHNKRVAEKLTNYLSSAWLVNQINSNAVRQGTLQLNLDQPNPEMDRYLWQHMNLFPNLTWITLGTESGASTGIWRSQEQAPLQISISNRANRYYGHYFATNQQGQKTKLLKVESPPYDPRKRPWYQEAIAARKPVWNKIYAGFTPGTVFIAASQPLYDPQGKLVGVSGTDISLLNIQKFLVDNPISPSGQVFVIERSGLLVASSSQEAPFQLKAGHPAQRVHVLASNTPIIRSTATFLQQQIQDLSSLKQSKKFRLQQEQQSHFVQVIPFQMKGGLNWLIVMVVPESDVMGQIQTGTRTTILICLVAVLSVILLNAWISRRLVRSIQGLRDASQQITQGNLSQQVNNSKVQEFAILARSFNQMSQELELSRQQLENYSRSLEQKVNERTQELQTEIQQRRMAEAALQAANRELEMLVYLDGLTQIANRRRFDEWLKREWAVSKREQVPLSLIICDVDYFKQYNDTYGHQLGDDCLCFIASAVAQAVRRPADLAARYGGEEFVVLLQNTSTEGAIEVAKAIQMNVQQLRIPHARSQVNKFVTLSFGITSCIPREEMRSEDFIENADRALYQAKQAGRNRFMVG
jgi:diguanylate cyclase (GGDEF)-like protein